MCCEHQRGPCGGQPDTSGIQSAARDLQKENAWHIIASGFHKKANTQTLHVYVMQVCMKKYQNHRRYKVDCKAAIDIGGQSKCNQTTEKQRIERYFGA